MEEYADFLLSVGAYLQREIQCEAVSGSSQAGVGTLYLSCGEIKEKSKERKTLLADKRGTPVWNIPKARKLASRIAKLTEQIEELQNEKNIVLQYLSCDDDQGISAVKKDISIQKDSLQKILRQEEKYAAELDAALKEYAELQAQAADLDPIELYNARQELRPDKEQDAAVRIQKVYGKKYSPQLMVEANGKFLLC